MVRPLPPTLASLWPWPASSCLPSSRSQDEGRASTRGNATAAQRLLTRVSRPAVPPLHGRLVALEFSFLASVGSSFASAWCCFNLSVAEMQSTQRAYFYQRFPILHLEPGDWPPGVLTLVCGASRAVWGTLLPSVPTPWLFLPDCPFPWSAPGLWAGCQSRSWAGGNQHKNSYSQSSTP